ncbi:hypothetical protein VTL71DRAFT_14532 [Oculimacula yallundae]|uniref:Enoyl reductase (ER) domain-containing protein n=1 Tax=Oculimacula yallundae TaxID=86028 RepID=A0ABR4CIW9_9HELO
MSLPSTMLAITLSTPATYTPSNPPSSLHLTTLPLPIPSPTQCLLRIHATAITPYELSWPSPPSAPFPRIPAHDIAGTVISSPPSSKFRSGDEVFALLPFDGQGGMAEYAVCEVGLLAKMLKMDGFGFVDAAAVPRAAVTALQACEGLSEGEKVLVLGASGAVGKMVVQFARREVGGRGEVVAVGGAGCKGVGELGAGFVVDYRLGEGRWEDSVRKWVQGGEVDVLIDCLGGESLLRGTKLVKSGGRVMTVGSPPPEWAKKGEREWEEVEEEGLKKKFFIVEENGEQLEQIAKLIESGDLKTSVGLVIDGLTEDGVRDGYARGLRGGLSGSVVVKIV